MIEKLNFEENEIPFQTLTRFGLTEDMISDLPQHIYQQLLYGQRSPMLPIEVSSEDGTIIRSKARIQLMRNNDNVDVVFFPQLRKSKLKKFDEGQRNSLLKGKVITADVRTGNETGSPKGVKCFVQIDPSTRQVLYVPTYVVAKNIEIVSDIANLSSDNLQRIFDGDVVTFDVNEKPYTIGINLLSDFAVHLYDGDKQAWQQSIDYAIGKYNFALNGCWINEGTDGMRYVKEEDYDDSLNKEMERIKQQTLSKSSQPHESRGI